MPSSSLATHPTARIQVIRATARIIQAATSHQMQGVPQEVRFSAAVYDLDTIKRAAYRFTDKLAFNFSIEDGEIVCLVTQLAADVSDHIIDDFRNEVLDQDLRRSIAQETAGIRNVILAHVFSKTGLQSSE